MLPVIMGHTPAGSSMYQFIHYGQVLQSDRFRQYDHGAGGNLKLYGRPDPPPYNLTAVRAPVALHYSLNDWLSEPQDVQRLQRELGNVVGGFVTPDPKFNHFDFVWAIEGRSLVFNQVRKLMDAFE